MWGSSCATKEPENDARSARGVGFSPAPFLLLAAFLFLWRVHLPIEDHWIEGIDRFRAQVFGVRCRRGFIRGLSQFRRRAFTCRLAARFGRPNHFIACLIF